MSDNTTPESHPSDGTSWTPPPSDPLWTPPPAPTWPSYQPATPSDPYQIATQGGAGTPAQPNYGQPPSGQPTYGQTPYGQPTPSQPTTDQPAYGQTIPNQPGYVPPAYGQTDSQTPYGQPTSSQPAYGQTPYGQPTSSQPAYGQTPYGQPSYGATPWQLVPQKKRRTGLIIVSIIAVIVVVCGGLVAIGLVVSKSDNKSNAGSTGPQTVGSTNPTGGATPTPTATGIPKGDGTALKAHLVPYPSGAKTLKVDGSNNGVFTLTEFVKVLFGGDNDEKSLLKDRGFETAAEKRWISKGVEVHAQLIQFADNDGALSYLDGQHEAFTSDNTFPTRYSLSGVPNGYGYEKAGLDSDGYRHSVLMGQHGNIVVVLFFYQPSHLDRAPELALVKQQIAALP
jgi:hypothetical protein